MLPEYFEFTLPICRTVIARRGIAGISAVLPGKAVVLYAIFVAKTLPRSHR